MLIDADLQGQVVTRKWRAFRPRARIECDDVKSSERLYLRHCDIGGIGMIRRLQRPFTAFIIELPLINLVVEEARTREVERFHCRNLLDDVDGIEEPKPVVSPRIVTVFGKVARYTGADGTDVFHASCAKPIGAIGNELCHIAGGDHHAHQF